MFRRFKNHIELLPENSPYSLFFLLFSSCVLIFNNLWVPGMFMDGGIYAALGKNAALFNKWLVPSFSSTGFDRFFEHPPFYFMIQGALFKIFGISWHVARLNGFLFMIITILSLWILLNKHENKKFAYLTILILILCPPIIKKSRFPNMDLPLLLFTSSALLTYFTALKNGHIKYWILAGTFFGGGLLMKGHPALIVPFCIFVHMLITKNGKKLLNYKPWIAFIVGILIFSIWPILLWISGDIDIFQAWIQKQFLTTTINSRGKADLDFFLYFKILLKNCLPWFILSLMGTYKVIKNGDKNSLGYLFIIWFWGILLIFSIMRWKYSHYILPLYPAMAGLAAYTIYQYGNLAIKYFCGITRFLIVVTSVILIMFPITTNIRRDKEIFAVTNLTKHLKNVPDGWADVNNAYGYWSFASVINFSQIGEAYRISLDEFEKWIQGNSQKVYVNYKWIFYLKDKDIERVEKRHPYLFNKKLFKLISFKKKNITVLVDKSLISTSNKSLFYF